MTSNKWAQPQQISDVQAAFPASVTGTLLPPREEIPEEFYSRSNKWAEFVSHMFFRGWDGTDPVLIRNPDVDSDRAFLHVQTVLKSFEPRHQDKEAGAAYLLSLWFADVMPAADVEPTA